MGKKNNIISTTVAMKPTPVPKQLRTMKPVGTPRSMPMAKAPKVPTTPKVNSLKGC